MQIELHVIFIGRVQGVAFRYNTRQLLSAYPIAGWVKNVSNGTVEMLAQGEKTVLERGLAAIQNYFKDNIRETRTNWRKPGKEYSSFQITY